MKDYEHNQIESLEENDMSKNTQPPSFEDTSLQVERMSELMLRFGLSELDITLGAMGIRIKRTLSPLAVPSEIKKEADTATPAPGTHVMAPTVGTFYAKPSPEAPDFVALNHHVQKDQVLGLVECMKVFHPVKAPCSGRIISIDISHGHSVEFNQILMTLLPDAP